MEKSLAVFYKTKHATSFPYSWEFKFSEKRKILGSHKNLYRNVYSSFIWDSQKLGTQVPFTRVMI